MTPAPDKAEIRRRMKARRVAVKPAALKLASHAVCERLLMRLGDARLVCAYHAFANEIDLSEFIEKCGCEVVFPERVGGDGPVPTAGGEYIVKRAAEVDMWICPGLAFTREGDRCGFGGGWYDRFLAAAKPSARKYGVGHHFQLVDALPREEHDIPLDEIIVDEVSLDFERQEGEGVMGIDEAGRGPLVGGVYAAAVTAPLGLAEELIRGSWRAINDSKQLTEKKREELAEVIKSTPGCRWAIASASAKEIDELNILRATHLAMGRAAEELLGRRLVDGGVKALVDGLPVRALPGSRNLVKGDAKSLFIAAASILAKTARDADCLRLERLYPGYGIAVHKGYPVPAHLEALKRLGPCAEHRRSFGPVKAVISAPTAGAEW